MAVASKRLSESLADRDKYPSDPIQMGDTIEAEALSPDAGLIENIKPVVAEVDAPKKCGSAELEIPNTMTGKVATRSRCRKNLPTGQIKEGVGDTPLRIDSSSEG